MKTAACRSCRAPIYWIELNGKPHPIDAAPAKNGTIAVAWNDSDGDRVPARTLRGGDRPFPAESVHLSHFATCPDAAKHRKPTEPERAPSQSSSRPEAEPRPNGPPPSSQSSKPPRISVAKRITEDARAAGCVVLLLYPDGSKDVAWWGETSAAQEEIERLADEIVR